VRKAVAAQSLQRCRSVPEQFMTPPFAAVTNFEGRHAIVSLRGRVDDVAAFELAAVLDAAIDCSPSSMVLELANLIFMGAASSSSPTPRGDSPPRALP
jgi:hypothetical protein